MTYFQRNAENPGWRLGRQGFHLAQMVSDIAAGQAAGVCEQDGRVIQSD